MDPPFETPKRYNNRRICSLNSSVSYNLNFSIAWLKQNHPTNDLYGHHFQNTQINEVPIPNVDLYYAQNSTIKSEYTNSSSEMCYISMSQGAGTYTFQIVNKDFDQEARLAYAWSTSNRNKELHHVAMDGVTAVGKSLSITSYCNDGTAAPQDSVDYQWKRSNDGVVWQSIIGANNVNYTLTSSDCLKYIKCEVTPNDTSIVTSTMKYSETNKRVVLYGDADLDGDVTVLDATHIQRYLVDLVSFDEENYLAADVDGDGTVTLFDVALIQYYLLGDIDYFPVEN